jgi:putative transposase
MHHTELLLQSNFYHIFNRGTNGCILFREHDNYRYFPDLYDKHISPVSDTYAWVFMPNHFHLLVRIKDEAEMRSNMDTGIMLYVAFAMKTEEVTI